MNKENNAALTESVDSKNRDPADDELENDFIQKLADAKKLKDYAINSNLGLPDDVIEALNKASDRKMEFINRVISLDQAIRDITEITYPTTIETVSITDKVKPTRQLNILLMVSVPALILAILTAHIDIRNYSWAPSVLAVCLGLLGSIVNVFFHVIGVMKERAVTDSSAYENSIRVVLGGILGWLLFFAIRPNLTIFADESSKGAANLLVLTPFLAGFSTNLVFGVLNQAVKAVEITLGIKDSSTELMKRNRTKPSKPLKR